MFSYLKVFLEIVDLLSENKIPSKTKEEMKKDKIQILWEVNSFPAIEIKEGEEERED